VPRIAAAYFRRENARVACRKKLITRVALPTSKATSDEQRSNRAAEIAARMSDGIHSVH
jgi:hypothetical protein